MCQATAYRGVMPIRGSDLRKERRAAEVTVTAVARMLGVSRQTIHTLEQPDRLADLDRANAYLTAVKTLRDAKDKAA
jgi:predicted transcriptional regulator